MSVVMFEQNARHCIFSAYARCVQHWSHPPTFEDLAVETRPNCRTAVRAGLEVQLRWPAELPAAPL
jgi:hypothetical protein